MLSTTPENSAAGENGNGGLCWYLPATISVSKKLSAAALIRTTAWPAAGLRLGDIGKFKFPGRAEMGAEDGFHRFPCPAAPAGQPAYPASARRRYCLSHSICG